MEEFMRSDFGFAQHVLPPCRVSQNRKAAKEYQSFMNPGIQIFVLDGKIVQFHIGKDASELDLNPYSLIERSVFEFCDKNDRAKLQKLLDSDNSAKIRLHFGEISVTANVCASEATGMDHFPTTKLLKCFIQNSTRKSAAKKSKYVNKGTSSAKLSMVQYAVPSTASPLDSHQISPIQLSNTVMPAVYSPRMQWTSENSSSNPRAPLPSSSSTSVSPSADSQIFNKMSSVLHITTTPYQLQSKNAPLPSKFSSPKSAPTNQYEMISPPHSVQNQNADGTDTLSQICTGLFSESGLQSVSIPMRLTSTQVNCQYEVAHSMQASNPANCLQANIIDDQKAPTQRQQSVQIAAPNQSSQEVDSKQSTKNVRTRKPRAPRQSKQPAVSKTVGTEKANPKRKASAGSSKMQYQPGSSDPRLQKEIRYNNMNNAEGMEKSLRALLESDIQKPTDSLQAYSQHNSSLISCQSSQQIATHQNWINGSPMQQMCSYNVEGQPCGSNTAVDQLPPVVTATAAAVNSSPAILQQHQKQQQHLSSPMSERLSYLPQYRQQPNQPQQWQQTVPNGYQQQAMYAQQPSPLSVQQQQPESSQLLYMRSMKRPAVQSTVVTTSATEFYNKMPHSQFATYQQQASSPYQQSNCATQFIASGSSMGTLVQYSQYSNNCDNTNASVVRGQWNNQAFQSPSQFVRSELRLPMQQNMQYMNPQTSSNDLSASGFFANAVSSLQPPLSRGMPNPQPTQLHQRTPLQNQQASSPMQQHQRRLHQSTVPNGTVRCEFPENIMALAANMLSQSDYDICDDKNLWDSPFDFQLFIGFDMDKEATRRFVKNVIS